MASSIARNLKPWPVLRRIPRYPTTQTTGSRLLSTETAKASPQLESSNSPTPPTKNARIKERRDWSTSMDEVKNRTIFIDIPKSMIQADVKRMLQSIDVKGIKEVQLHYSQFVRDGGAYVIFASSSERNAALHTLENYSKSRPYLLRNPRPVQHPSYRIEDEVDEKGQLKKVVMSTRRRGVEGTNEALLKGTVNGTGGNANIQDRGTSVLLSGFYRACDVERLSRDFRGKFAVRDDVEAILKVPSPNPRTSSFLVRCESSAEAHRLVRTAHHSHLRSAVKEGTPELTAKVIY
ncbi:hypothetical protein FRC03_009478 [Tulasnella sp. 419]|nr:hypothetical protein FRC03_009478 [Tulasnella sp. 419]